MGSLISKKALFLGVLFGILGGFFLYKRETVPKSKEDFFARVSDPSHPTIRDYTILQKCLETSERPELSSLKDYERRFREFKLIGKQTNQVPEWGRVCVNSSDEERENCLLLYAFYNKNYPWALKRLLEWVKASDFKGDVLYRIGGWPNVEGGDLGLAFVPYSFKVCFFQEAKRLGYKRALWLDSSIKPIVSLNDQFAWIAEKGYLALGNTHYVGPFFNERSASAFNLSLEETFSIPSVSAGVFGLDFSVECANQALQSWYDAAKDPAGFFSARPEQNALSIILYKLGMTDWIPYERVAESIQQIDSSFYLSPRSSERS